MNHSTLVRSLLAVTLLGWSGGCCHPVTRVAPPRLQIDKAAAKAFAERINLDAPEAPDRRLIRRAVYRTFLEEHDANELYFLEVEPDEPPNFKLTYDGFRVRSAAVCVYDQKRGVMKDNNTGEEGIVLFLPDADIEIAGTSARSHLTCHYGSGVIMYDMQLRKSDDDWIVVDKKTGWIIDSGRWPYR